MESRTVSNKVVLLSTARFSLEILCSTLRLLSASTSLMFKQLCFQNQASTLEHGVEDPGALPIWCSDGRLCPCPYPFYMYSSYTHPLTAVWPCCSFRDGVFTKNVSSFHLAFLWLSYSVSTEFKCHLISQIVSYTSTPDKLVTYTFCSIGLCTSFYHGI